MYNGNPLINGWQKWRRGTITPSHFVVRILICYFSNIRFFGNFNNFLHCAMSIIQWEHAPCTWTLFFHCNVNSCVFHPQLQLCCSSMPDHSVCWNVLKDDWAYIILCYFYVVILIERCFWQQYFINLHSYQRSNMPDKVFSEWRLHVHSSPDPTEHHS